MSVINRGFQIIASIVLLTLIYRLTVHFTHLYFDRMIQRANDPGRQKTLRDLIKNIATYIYYFMLGYSLLAIMGVPVATLVAGAGVASLAIGIGAQGLVNDTVNGFFILLEHQYDVGDNVTISNINGQIKQIGIKTTVIQGWDGSVNYIPNRNIDIVINHSREPIRVDIDLPYYADTDIEQLTYVLKARMAKVGKNDPLLVRKTQYLGPTRDANGQFIYRVRMWSDNMQEVAVQSKYYRQFTDAIKQAGIPLPEGNVYRIIEREASHDTKEKAVATHAVKKDEPKDNLPE
ncbi:MAG: mechanosensitive ion channel family protein [Aerococcus sp.]|nr:mechanosensitive ion channel family protein [Aerococcus sp.]